LRSPPVNLVTGGSRIVGRRSHTVGESSPNVRLPSVPI
jgi:hypothetical protein